MTLPPPPEPNVPEGDWLIKDSYIKEYALAYAQQCVQQYKADAERYRWLKSRHGLTLRAEKQPNLWTRMDGTEFSATYSLAEGGTQHAPAESLDATIDAAILAAATRKEST